MARNRLIRVKKNKHKLEDVEVNTISLMDILTTLLFFLIIISTIDKAFILDATSLSVGKPADNPKQVFTLTVNFVNANQAEFWLGPVDKLQIKNKEKFLGFMNKFFAGTEGTGFGKKLLNKDREALVRRVQKILIFIKKSFPEENKIVLGFSDAVLYEDLIYAVEGVRSLSDYFKPFVTKNALGKTEKTRVLFPEVVISEWQIQGDES